MTKDFFHKEGSKLIRTLPIYLGIQLAILLLTFLDFPVYMEAYLAQHSLTVSGWLGIWFLLVTFGLATGLILLVSKTWEVVFSPRERAKLAGGYLLGAAAGLLTLGLRFMPVMPAEYFWVVGGLVLLLAAGYLIWTRRQPKPEEIFP